MLPVESYIHQNHCAKKSWIKVGIKDGQYVNRSSSRGKRLIILHAITDDGPVVTRDENGMPIADFVFGSGASKDIAKTPTEGLTCELLWTASQHTGDYQYVTRSNTQKFY